MIKTLRLKTSTARTEIQVGRGALGRIKPSLAPSRSFYLIADRRVMKAARELATRLKRQGASVHLYWIDASERAKELRQAERIFAWLSDRGANRHSVLIAIGGGVVGDLAGFVAGTYMRGIPWVGVPTTLLAQVDSSVGGKTGVNLIQGKNLVGVFHQPIQVVCETSVLKTLPERERVSGLGEMIKYGLIQDAALFSRLERNWSSVLELSPQILAQEVSRCLVLKARAVEKDERDRLGVREVLNFGHTVGHALEAATKYRAFRHGEAVILGMRAAAKISVLRGRLEFRDWLRVESLLAELPVPRVPRSVRASELLSLIARDKKATPQGIRFVLLKKIGQTVLDAQVTASEILPALSLIGVR